MNPSKVFPIALLVLGLGVATAQAASVQPYQPASFAAAQQADQPILIFVEAPWCPVCAKERPILASLYDTPDFKNLQVFTVDFDTSKALLQQLGVQKQSTLIVYHGGKETGRATGVTDPDAIKKLLEAARS